MARKPSAADINAAQQRLGAAYRDRQSQQNTPTFNAFAEEWQKAQDEGLKAAARVYRDNVRIRLRMGYTHGNEVTGESAAAVKAGSPTTSRSKGYRYVRVYAKDFKQIFWEYGWWWAPNRRQMKGKTRRERKASVTAASGRYFRVSHWANAARDAGPVMAKAFHGAFNDVIQRGGR